MAWPSHTKAGEMFTADQLLQDIIFVCQMRLDSGGLPPLYESYYGLILSHAQLCGVNHAHGLHRDFIRPDGSGEPPMPATKLDAAWDHVNAAHALVTAPAPPLSDLMSALDEIDHGGGGGTIT